MGRIIKAIRKLVNRAAAAERAGSHSADDALWRVLSGLRGPDSESVKAKDVGAARVRGRLGLPGEYFSVNTDGEAIVTSLGPEHYRRHMAMARDGLESLGYE